MRWLLSTPRTYLAPCRLQADQALRRFGLAGDAWSLHLAVWLLAQFNAHPAAMAGVALVLFGCAGYVGCALCGALCRFRRGRWRRQAQSAQSAQGRRASTADGETRGTKCE